MKHNFNSKLSTFIEDDSISQKIMHNILRTAIILFKLCHASMSRESLVLSEESPYKNIEDAKFAKTNSETFSL